MKINNDIKYEINSNIIKNYVDVINSMSEPMSQIKEQLKDFSESTKEPSDRQIKNSQPIYVKISTIKEMLNSIKKLSATYPNEQTKILTSVIKQIMKTNNGIISSRMIEPLEISRQYLSNLETNNEIEKVSRGIYISPDAFEDSYYSFQAKYKRIVFSHMNALYFYGMTEETPYNYTITVPQSYHVDSINEKCNVFYVADDIFELGLCEIETPNGNKVRTYDLERSICDIIRSKNRMDLEQVKKSIKRYIKSKDKNMIKLSEYSKKMGINKQVIEMVGMYND